MKNVLLVGDKDPYAKWSGYADAFVNTGWNVTVVFYYRNPIQTGVDTIRDGISTVVIGPEPGSNGSPPVDLVDFVEMESGYGSMPRFLFNEVFLYEKSYRSVVDECNAIWPVIRNLFRTKAFDLVVQNQGASPLRRLSFALARTKSIPVLYFDVAWFGDRMFISDNEMNMVPEYRPLQPHEISSETYAKVNAFRAAQRERRATYQYRFDDSEAMPLRRRIGVLTKKTTRKNWFRAFCFRIARLRKRLRSIRVRVLFDRFNTAEPPDAPFFYLPLHYPKDSQLALRAQEYLRQEALVEFVHWNLPHGTRLVVKAHPHAAGDYEITAFRHIKRLPHVTLLRANYSSHTVLEHPNCRGTIVLNSSVGFESILYGKPVVALAAFYGIHYPGVIFPTKSSELAGILCRLSAVEIEDEQCIAALSSIYAVTWPGSIYVPHIEYAKVVGSVLMKYEKMKRISAGTDDVSPQCTARESQGTT